MAVPIAERFSGLTGLAWLRQGLRAMLDPADELPPWALEAVAAAEAAVKVAGRR